MRANRSARVARAVRTAATCLLLLIAGARRAQGQQPEGGERPSGEFQLYQRALVSPFYSEVLAYTEMFRQSEHLAEIEARLPLFRKTVVTDSMLLPWDDRRLSVPDGAARLPLSGEDAGRIVGARAQGSARKSADAFLPTPARNLLAIGADQRLPGSGEIITRCVLYVGRAAYMGAVVTGQPMDSECWRAGTHLLLPVGSRIIVAPSGPAPIFGLEVEGGQVLVREDGLLIRGGIVYEPPPEQ